MNKAFARWMRVLPVTLGCLMVAATASAQDPLPMGSSVGADGGAMVGYAGDRGLFQQYYPNGAGSPAGLYPAPLPVPTNVGHVYYTYQPFYPHEMMYAHKRTYYTPYAGPSSFYQGHSQGYGLNKTTVTWQSGAYSFNPLPINVFPGNGRFSGLIGGGYGLPSGGGCSNCR